MNVNKKLGRFKQWAGERMGGEVKTNVSDDFKAMEAEMALRHDGLERLHKAMTAYIRAISKRNEGDGGKLFSIGYLGGAMVNHGQDFESNSEFGQCLISFGRTNERCARIQEQYVADATSSWLESLDRSLAQMKEYQAARKKLESRRLAYDTSLAKMQKAKREDFRVEEELRLQKVKYEEANEDVYRRMQDIRESEADNISDLRAFFNAQLNYHDQCREVLLQLRDEWPTGQSPVRRPNLSRNTTAHSFHERFEPEDQPLDARPPIRPTRTASSCLDSPLYKPPLSRTSTFEGPTQLRGRVSPPHSGRVVSDSASINSTSSHARTANGRNYDGHYGYPDDGISSPHGKVSPDRFTSSSLSGSSSNPLQSRPVSMGLYSNGNRVSSSQSSIRAKKPPPPPPPKRNALRAVDM
ncbi:BAR domain-containing protein [Coccidioides immitis RS]|uniref:BAR domain-containing protein n=2 Tax=Coccidioides immitis TaxID=5501 RepID=A0A0E1S1P2_COCIM|nr:BAR domain-containing protein [Coccidioides immitis RS]EAS30561.1 BAR domain-containing protein [Coccidioides immitis RS]KMP03109.1 BAR domain containing protein [Coccidioides immitis RMSCC 2394]